MSRGAGVLNIELRSKKRGYNRARRCRIFNLRSLQKKHKMAPFRGDFYRKIYLNGVGAY